MKLEITFKNGTQVTVDVSEFTTKRSTITGELTELNWTTPKTWKRKLHTLDVSEILCLVAVD